MLEWTVVRHLVTGGSALKALGAAKVARLVAGGGAGQDRRQGWRCAPKRQLRANFASRGANPLALRP